MTAPSAGAPADLARRLERFRAGRLVSGSPGPTGDPLPHRRIDGRGLADRLATALDGEVVETALGRYVRVEGGSSDLPVDRARLATLPDHPPSDRPLVCLATETTGLA